MVPAHCLPVVQSNHHGEKKRLTLAPRLSRSISSMDADPASGAAPADKTVIVALAVSAPTENLDRPSTRPLLCTRPTIGSSLAAWRNLAELYEKHQLSDHAYDDLDAYKPCPL